LIRAHLFGVGPFGDVVLPFCDEDGVPRRTVVVHGAGGAGKTLLLSVINATRPGHSVVLSSSVLGGVPSDAGDEPPRAACEWRLGTDDPGRPHPLLTATPGAKLGLVEEVEMFRRREQTLFDKNAQAGGFAFALLSAQRWFSRQPVAIHAPLRTVARHDVRRESTLEDGARADLARETKQALAYAEIGAALAQAGNDHGRRLDLLGSAMRHALAALLGPSGFTYRGLDAASFEPMFHDAEGRERSFDALPTRVRHLVAFAALPVRMLFAAYPGADPVDAEGVVAIDEADLHQDPQTLAGLIPALNRALPRVQWILTTSSATLAGSADARDVLALRRSADGDGDRVELCIGEAARTH
jgi:hypothetical protein